METLEYPFASSNHAVRRGGGGRRVSGHLIDFWSAGERNHGFFPRFLRNGRPSHSSGVLVALAVLQAKQAVTRLSSILLPPRLTGNTWSQVSVPARLPQYTQAQPSR